MKIEKSKLFTLCLLLLFVLTACSPKGEISTVAAGYLKALVDYRLDDAKKFGDITAVRFVEQQQAILDSWTPEEREEARKNLENTEVKIVDVEVTDAKAVVRYELIKDGSILQSERLYLRKNSAGWQVYESL